jgi:hypothetical protein
MKIPISTISFPEISLHPHYGHKLRGYIGNLFKEKSPLLHNHLEGGGLRYSYPLVQYKIIDGVPMLLGLGEGAELLIDLFLIIKDLNLYDKKFVIYSKNIENHLAEIGIKDSLIEYNFKTLWMGLNQSNFNKYNKLLPGEEKTAFLNKILIGNILSFYKGIGFTAEERIYAKVSVSEKITEFKNNKMTAFSGTFVSNAKLPNLAGLGKAVARGFGAVSDTP